MFIHAYYTPLLRCKEKTLFHISRGSEPRNEFDLIISIGYLSRVKAVPCLSFADPSETRLPNSSFFCNSEIKEIMKGFVSDMWNGDWKDFEIIVPKFPLMSFKIKVIKFLITFILKNMTISFCLSVYFSFIFIYAWFIFDFLLSK